MPTQEPCMHVRTYVFASSRLNVSTARAPHAYGPWAHVLIYMKGIYEGSFDYLHTGRVWRVIVCRLCVTQLQDISIGVTGMFTGMSTC